MNEIYIKFSNDSYIQIELLKNNFVDEWLEIFQKTSKLNVGTFKISPLVGLQYNDNKINESIDRLNEIFDKFDSLTGVSVNIPVLTRKNISRKLCNKIHRIFTTLVNSQGTRYNFSSLTQLKGLDLKTHRDLIYEINDNIHYIEKIFHAESEFLKNNQLNYGLLNFKSKKLEKIRKDHFKFLTNDPQYDVFINTNICGKSYLNCFWDNDIPTNYDIKNEESYCADLEFFIHKPSMIDLMKHNEFTNWLQKYILPVNNITTGKMSVGKIKDKLLKDIDGIEIKNIEYA
jgi:hypothetical protein